MNLRSNRIVASIPGWALLAALLSGCAATGTPSAPPKRNVILFLGDGMGVSTVTAARIYAGQRTGQPGEENLLSFEHFPDVALIKTYNTDSQVPDSAGTMSAIMTGEKTRIGVISVDKSVSLNDCPAALVHPLPTLLEAAEDRGFATGVVSTARITHATPAATYAHVPNRNWEADADLPPTAVQAGCTDIAAQLVTFPHGDGIDVILGGGRAEFLPTSEADPEYPAKYGLRTDGTNLMQQWAAAAPDRHVVWNGAQFDSLSGSGQTLGLFEPSHMKFEADREKDPATEPSLAEMTAFAIRRLQQNPKGFFLMVEGGRIDHGHHAGNAYRALTDTVEFADAVQAALALTDPADTLILVTADHSHTLTMSGYPKRGNPILGKVETALGPATDAQGHPYTTLSYANGPGYREPLPDLSSVNTEDPNYLQVATLPMGAETHGGEDVPAYATGLGASGVHGVMEQNRLYDVMREALFGEGD